MRNHWRRTGAAIAAAGLVVLAPTSAIAADHDPRGANGTVKIDSSPDGVADSTDNEPHTPCVFEVEFFGFDEGQVGDIVLTAHPPTGRGETLAQDRRTVSRDPAGGAHNDPDEAFRYDLSDAPAGMTAHPRQGYHVKLTVELYNQDGSAVPNDDGTPVAKHKVFWVEGCAGEDTATGGTGAGGSGDSGSGNGGTGTENGNGGGGGTGGEGTGGVDTDNGTGTVAGTDAGGSGGGSGEGARAETAGDSGSTAKPAEAVSAARTVAGAALAHTGAGRALLVAVAGAGLLAAGVLLTVLGRRRATPRGR